MKSLSKIIFILVLACSFIFTLASCTGDDDGVGEDGHTHEWGTLTVLEKADCYNEGCNEYVCSVCSESQYELIPALGHSWGPQFVRQTEPSLSSSIRRIEPSRGLR